MAKRKSKKEESEIITSVVEEVEEVVEKIEPEIIAPVEEITEEVKTIVNKKPKTVKKAEPKYKIGSIVFISKDAGADLNGFKLFPTYKKYTYTVESYDEATKVYTLRRLNLILKMNEENIVSPEERAHDPLNRMQF